MVNTDELTRWLDRCVGAVTPPVRVSRIGAGQSNVTYLVEDGAARPWILRCPPSGQHDCTAHNVLREARILRALAGSAVPVPAVVAADRDTGGIEGPFVVMERVPGEVLAEERDAELLSGTNRLQLSEHVIAVLAALHAIRPEQVGLSDLSRRACYLERQIARTVRNWGRWGEQSPAERAWEECRRRLTRRIPAQQRTVLTHGDYRLSNLLTEEGRVNAVLDWELCTLGDPLADLAWLVDDWRGPDEPAVAVPSPTRVGGFLDREQIVSTYADATGLDVAELDYYRAFTHWKAATLLQGVLLRRRAGQLGDHGELNLLDLESTITFLVDEALELVRP